MSDGGSALQALPAQQVQNLVMSLVQATLPDDLMVVTQSEIEAMKLRAYAHGWQDGMRRESPAEPPAQPPSAVEKAKPPDAAVFSFPQPLPLVAAADTARQGLLMPHRLRRSARAEREVPTPRPPQQSGAGPPAGLPAEDSR
ncbi:hypothetical protein [Streptomyces zagrosensis]|uniref:Uncharacterized protein n=1 Tax=Streptomyces zagrosensis TaxID=1042984 RepID=A0A7W9QH68_9ACTN|nr:hypothetical protein [Streptomyces zagrosensis]MBB5940086.1 hypothetical protein [Streptomyces zagrosensis]